MAEEFIAFGPLEKTAIDYGLSTEEMSQNRAKMSMTKSKLDWAKKELRKK